MMLAAKTFEITFHRRAADGRVVMVERDRMIDVTMSCRTAAAGESTRQVSTPDGTLERCRRLIPQCGRGTRLRICQPQRSRRGQFAYLLGIDDAVALQVTRQIALAQDGLLAGDDGDNDLRRGRTVLGSDNVDPAGTLRSSASARQSAALGQCGQRVGAAMIECPRIGRAHLLG